MRIRHCDFGFSQTNFASDRNLYSKRQKFENKQTIRFIDFLYLFFQKKDYICTSLCKNEFGSTSVPSKIRNKQNCQNEYLKKNFDKTCCYSKKIFN